MTKRSLFASFLLLSSALVSPAALAQTAESDPAPTETPPADPADDVAADPAVGEEVDVSIPGGAAPEIGVTGRNRNGRAACWERVGQDGWNLGGAVSVKKKKQKIQK